MLLWEFFNPSLVKLVKKRKLATKTLPKKGRGVVENVEGQDYPTAQSTPKSSLWHLRRTFSYFLDAGKDPIFARGQADGARTGDLG